MLKAVSFFTKHCSRKVIEAVEEQYLSTNILDQGVMERPVLPNNLEALRSVRTLYIESLWMR